MYDKLSGIQKKGLAVFVVFVLMVTTFGIGYVSGWSAINMWADQQTYIGPGSLVSESSYTVFVDNSGAICAKNGETGRIDFRSSNASYIMQLCVNSASGRISTIGDFTITYKVMLLNGTILNLGSSVLTKTWNGPVFDTVGDINNITIEGGIIDGNKAHYTGTGITIGESYGNSTDVVIDGVTIYNTEMESIMLLGTTRFIITDCVIRESSYHGIIVTNDCFDGSITNCLVENSEHFNIYVYGSQRVVVGNCVTNGGYGGFIAEGRALAPMRDVQFTNCIASNFIVGFHVENGGEQYGSSNVTYSNCRAISSPELGFICFLANFGTYPTHDLTYINCVADGAEKAYYGFNIGAIDFQLIGCTASNASNTGILVDNGGHPNGTVHNGIVSSCISYSNLYNGIMVANHCENVSVVGNLAYNNPSYNYSFSGSNLTIANNIGYKNIATGIAVMNAGDTSVTVHHGLNGRPLKIVVCGTNAQSVSLFVNPNYTTDTVFKIESTITMVYNTDIVWYAEV